MEVNMASIVKRGKTFSVVYTHYNNDGKRKQKWETYKSIEEAERRKNQIENATNMVVRDIYTVSELCDEYIESYGKLKWSYTTYQGNTSIIKRYVLPKLGNCRLSELSPRLITKFYQSLLSEYSVKYKYKNVLITHKTVLEVDKLLKSIFRQAVLLRIIEINPMVGVILPKVTKTYRNCLSAEQISYLLSMCDDQNLLLIIQIAFACSLRKGEILGLTWEDIDFKNEVIYVNKELIRVQKSTINELSQDEIIHIFKNSDTAKTVLVLKTPKTSSSVRKVYVPKTLLERLALHKKLQDSNSFNSCDLLFVSKSGNPLDGRGITEVFKKYLVKCDLPTVVFHSIRNSSVTYKLEITNGNIKSVQGDTGHAEAKMITDTYACILDKSRADTAKIFENQFYGYHTHDNKDRVIDIFSSLSYEEKIEVLQILSKSKETN